MSSKLAAALEALYARVPLGMRLGLDPMRAVCTRLGDPQDAFASVHIGGTNGKGSTSAMVESIARASGQKTGMYTSPHLCRFAERIRIDGEPITDDVLVSVLDEALTVGRDLSFFETATLAAFLAFRAAKIDLGVIEVGIGGRLDATNILAKPRCTAIVNVAFDHMEKLGDTLDLIAREKAAIAKPGVPMVLGPMPDEPRRAATEIASSRGARVIAAHALPSDVAIGLEGVHQRANASVAWTIGGELGWDEGVRRAGIASARWPGRVEHVVVNAGALAGEWILDGAHNPDGMRALVTALASRPVGAVVFGALGDKAWREMLSLLEVVSAPRFYVEPKGRAPASPSELASLAAGTPCASLDEALLGAARASAERPVVVCGSLYLVGAARARLLDLAVDPIVAL